jgi:hypothetical protein
MAIIKWEYGKWNNVIGYQCSQCGKCYPFVAGALQHEEQIDNNGGVCPDAPVEEAPDAK